MPDDAARNGGSPPLSRGSTSSAVRRSLIEPSSARAILAKSSAKRDWLAVEVPAADHPAAAGRDRVDIGDPAAGEDERIVGRRVELDVEDATQMVERIAHRAVDLWRAAQRVRVLDLVGVSVMAGLQSTVAEQVAQLRGHGDLARMRPGQLVRGSEGHVRPEQRLHGHRRDHARGPHQPIRIGQHERAERAHHLRPVQQREPLLGLEDERLEAGLAQGADRRHDRATDLDLAEPDERQRQVRERREITRRADAALLRHDRMDAPAEQLEQAIDDERPAAAVAERQGVRAQDEHRPDDLARERRPDAGRVTHQQIRLEPAGLGRRDRGRR